MGEGKIAEAISEPEAAEKLDVSERCEMTDRMNLIMLEIERIVQAKLDDGQTVEDLEKDFDKLVIECLPALTARNRQVETLPPLPCPPSHEVCRVDTGGGAQ